MRTPTLLLLATLAVTHAHEHEGLAPFHAELPGKFTLENTEKVPAKVKAFLPFKEQLGLSWDEEFLYVEGNGLPKHPMMVGITSWQQQVPLPHNFTGKNRFKIPLTPKLIKGEPQELTLKGPIAIAVNGIPIFHALTQSGNDAYASGELDKWGGHCGRADDYHYHIAPSHLEPQVGEGKPVAFGMDGYPIYLANPKADKPLDECHGYFDDKGNYRYVGSLKPPYTMAYFRGEADLKDRPPTHPIRPFLRPLAEAHITDFNGNLEKGFHLTYQIGKDKGQVNYALTDTEVKFQFVKPNGDTKDAKYPKKVVAK